jgi:hypothetical protein
MNLSSFIENTNNPQLSRAVIKQFGKWTDWKKSASDIANHGPEGGVSNFIYHTDTVAFYEANKGNIHAMARETIEAQGFTTLAEFVAVLNYVRLGEYEVARALEDGEDNEDYIHVANALAWFALEKTAYLYDCKINE